MAKKIGVATDQGEKIIEVDGEPTPQELDVVAEEVRGKYRLDPMAPSGTMGENLKEAVSPKKIADSLNPVESGFPYLKGLKALGRMTEGFQQGVGALADQAHGLDTPVLPAVFRGLKGEDIEGLELQNKIAGEDTVARDTKNINEMFGSAGPTINKILDHPIVPSGRSGMGMEFAVDPLNLVGTGMGSKLAGGISRLFRGGPRAGEAIKAAESIPAVAEAFRGRNIPIEGAQVAEEVTRAAPTEIPTGFRGRGIPTNVAPFDMPPINPATPEDIASVLARADRTAGVPSPILPPGTPPVPSPSPLIVPEQFNGARNMGDELRLMGAGDQLGAPPMGVNPGAQLPSALPVDYPFPKGMRAAPMAPEAATVDDIEEAMKAGTYKGQVGAQGVPPQFRGPVLPAGAPGAAVDDMSGKSFLQVINEAIGKKGAVGKDIGSSASQQAARAELERRVAEIAKKTGQNADEVLRQLIANPQATLRSLNIAESQGQKIQVPGQFRSEAGIIPEGPQAIRAQMQAMTSGRVPAVLVTPGGQIPPSPPGFVTTKTPVGTFIHNPAKVSPQMIQQAVQKGEHGALLGHVQPKPAAGQPFATVAAQKAGQEVKTSVVPPEFAGAQADVLKKQFPDADVRVGGEKLAEETIAARKGPIVNQPIPEEFNMTERNRVAWEDAQRAAKEEMERLGKKGRPGKLEDLQEKYYKQARGEAGIVETPDSLAPGFNSAKDTTAGMNDVQRKTGVEVGSYTQKLVEKEFEMSHKLSSLEESFDFKGVEKLLKRRGISGEKAYDLLHYVESGPNGPRWNPSAYEFKNAKGKVEDTIPAFKGAQPSPDVLQGLFQLRQAYDRMHQIAQVPGRLERYVPRISKIPEITGMSSRGNFMRAKNTRSWKDVPLEKNLWKVTEGYKRQLAKDQIFTDDLINEGTQYATQLRLLGKEGVATQLEKTIAKTMGLGSKENLTELQVDAILKMNEKELDQVRKNLGLDPPGWKKFLKEMRSQISYSFFGLKPRNWIANALQPELSGWPEVGTLNSLVARFGRMKPTKADKALLKEVTPRLRAAHFDPTDNFSAPAKNIIAKAFRAPGVPGMKMLEIFDTTGREISFLAARRQFLKAKNTKGIMKDLLESEQQIVNDMLRTKGREAAAKEYGIIRSHRIMSRYSRTNRPAMLSGPVGENIPFTTYNRGELGKMVEDVRRGHYKQLAKRLVYPMLIAGTAGLVSGDIKTALYFHPFFSIFGLLQAGLSPIFGGGIVEGAQKGGVKGALKGAASLTATTALPLKIMKANKKK